MIALKSFLMVIIFILLPISSAIANEVEWNKRLEKNYQQLLQQLDAKDQKSLKIAQQKWIEFKEAEFAAIAALYASEEQENTRLKEARTLIVKDRAQLFKRYWYDFNPEEIPDIDSDSEEQHPIEQALDACLNKKSNQTDLATQACFKQAREQWDEELGTMYENLLQEVDDSVKPLVETAQQKWLQFRDAEFKAVYNMHNEENTQKIFLSTNMVELIKERIFALEDYLDDYIGSVN